MEAKQSKKEDTLERPEMPGVKEAPEQAPHENETTEKKAEDTKASKPPQKTDKKDTPKAVVKSTKNKIEGRKKRSSLSNFGIGKEKDFFIENLAMLFDSGMDIISAMEAIKSGVRTKQMKDILDQLIQDVDAGYNISDALEYTNLLPEHIISLIRVGEETGKLPENLKVVITQQEKDRTLRSKIQSGMMYPVLVLGMTLVIGIGIAWFILPQLSSVFDSLGLDLPLITQILISIGSFLGEHGIVVIPSALAFMGVVFYILFVAKPTKHIGQAILFNTPIIKKLIQEVELSRFGYILGTLFSSGLPIIKALDSLQAATTFRAFQKLYEHLRDSVEIGDSFKKSFETYRRTNRLVPIPVQHMIGAAENSGRLPETLTKIGEIYEAKTELTTKNLSVVLEPLLLVIIWAGVIGVAMAVVLPIYSLVGQIN